VVVNDGSKDKTLELLKQAFKLVEVPLAVERKLTTKPVRAMYISTIHPRITVVDKENGGKADALNAGINASSFPLFCAVDSDSLLDRTGLLKAVRPFIEDTSTVAVGGIVRIANGCTVEDGQIIHPVIPKNHWARFQVVEYLRAFLFGRMGWDALNSLLVISGAFGLFSKRAVLEVGGYETNSIGEDMELVVRMHRVLRRQDKPYRITFVPDPVCWTEVPESAQQLRAQRMRWQNGLTDALWRNRTLFYNPKYGWIGIFAYPFFVVFELLGAVVEAAGFVFFLWTWLTGLVDPYFASLFLMVAVALGVFLSLSSIALEELFFHRYLGWRQVVLLFCYGILENIGYRQLLSLWRLKGLINYIRGNHKWGDMQRTGLGQNTSPMHKGVKA
ncbi:MAG TPA: glycosyltransferase, partial [Bacillota bacterium]|nr:glycosyltransferase [Bacillota bacterium]